MMSTRHLFVQDYDFMAFTFQRKTVPISILTWAPQVTGGLVTLSMSTERIYFSGPL